MNLTDVDQAILQDLHVHGHNTPKNIKENIGKNREYVSDRLGVLEEQGLVKNKGGGVWKPTIYGTSIAIELLSE